MKKAWPNSSDKKKKKRGRKFTLKLTLTLPTGDEVADFFDGVRRGITKAQKSSKRWIVR